MSTSYDLQHTLNPPTDPYRFEVLTQSASLTNYAIWTGVAFPPPDLGTEADFYIHRVPNNFQLYFKCQGQWKRYTKEARSKQEAGEISHPINPDAILFVGETNVRWLSSWQVYKNERRSNEKNSQSEKHLPTRLWKIYQKLMERHVSTSTSQKEKRNAREREKRRMHPRWKNAPSRGSVAGSSYAGSPKTEEFSDNSVLGSDHEGSPEYELKGSLLLSETSPHGSRHRSSLPTPPPTGAGPSMRRRSATAPSSSPRNQFSPYPTPPNSQPHPAYQPHGYRHQPPPYEPNLYPSGKSSNSPPQAHLPSHPSQLGHPYLSNAEYHPSPKYPMPNQESQAKSQYYGFSPTIAEPSSYPTESGARRGGRPWEL